MPFNSTAQEHYALTPTSPGSMLPVNDQSFSHDKPLEVFLVPIDPPKDHQEDHQEEHLEVSEEPLEVEIVVEELPGAPKGTKDPEPTLEVVEEPLRVSEEQSDSNDASKGKKKNEKWDWEARGANGFVAWVQERLTTVPKHSGYDTAGLERASAYLDKLDNEISKAMRLDLDAELDADKVEEIRSKIDDGIARLHDRLDKVKKTSKRSKRKKKSEELDSSELQSFGNLEVSEDDIMVKEAQKITGIKGIMVTVPLLISSIGRICINGVISAGHDLNDMFQAQAEKYKLTDREKAEVSFYLFDSGYPLRVDRGHLPGDSFDTASENNFDWSANYKG